MSRHRNVRRMNYDEEYDGYDDVYGRSVEDDYCTSPSTAAQFIYDRNAQQHAMSAFIPGDDIPEEEPEFEGKEIMERADLTRKDSSDFGFPQLNPIDEARLRSCLDEIHNIVGDSIPEKTLVDAVIKNGFNLEKALDSVLSNASKTEPPKPQREMQGRRGIARQDAAAAARQLEFNGTLASNSERPVDKEVSSITESITTLSFPTSKPVITGFHLDETPTLSLDQAKSKNALNMEINGSAAKDVIIPQKPTSRGSQPSSKLDAQAEYERQRGGSKELLNLVVIGHVDAGKSTLMGHLLCLVGAVSKKVMHKYEQESKKIGKASFMYAWVLDETGEERSRGVTMDVGYSKFETSNKAVTLLDAPGHKDFIPNMITGAAQADVAILVVDATRGEFETGFETGGQTREHALLVRSLGVSQLAVAVNKLDTVNWAQDRFNDIVAKLSQFLKQAGFKEADLSYIPCSGLTGENLCEPPSVEELRKWYTGSTLLEQIDMFRSPDRPVSKPFRLCISDVFKSQGSAFSVAGKVETGIVQNGDKVLVMPIGEQAIVKSISMDEISQTSAFAGDQVVLSLSGIDQVNVATGCVACDLSQPILAATRFRARIVVFNIEIPITKGFQAILHYQALFEPVIIKRIISQLHKSTGEAMKKKPRCLLKHSNAVVELEVGRAICIEMYKDIKELGRFMLRSGGSTVAAGLVIEIL